MVFTCDIGTSSVKAGIINKKGELLAHDSIPLKLNKHLSLNPNSWFNALVQALKSIDKKLLSGVEAVIVSGNGPTMVPVDNKGEPLGPALLWSEKPLHLKLPFDSKSFFLPKIYWLSRHKPEKYKKIKFFLSCPEYICFKLTGKAITALPCPAYAPYYWNKEEISKLSLEHHKFPPFISIKDPVGNLSKASSKTLGLPSNIPILTGGPDFLMSLLGTGAIVPGKVNDREGSSEGINYCASRPVISKALRCFPGLTGDTYNISAILPTAGRVLQWAKELFFPTNISYEAILKMASKVSPGAKDILFAHIFRKTWEHKKTKKWFSNLAISNKHTSIMHALVQGLVFAVRQIIETIEEEGFLIKELIVSGGLAKSPFINQLKANILGKSVLIPEIIDAELTGNACLGFYYLGEYSSLIRAAESMVKIKKMMQPHFKEQARYDEIYKAYKELDNNSKKLDKDMDR